MEVMVECMIVIYPLSQKDALPGRKRMKRSDDIIFKFSRTLVQILRSIFIKRVINLNASNLIEINHKFNVTREYHESKKTYGKLRIDYILKVRKNKI